MGGGFGIGIVRCGGLYIFGGGVGSSYSSYAYILDDFDIRLLLEFDFSDLLALDLPF